MTDRVTGRDIILGIIENMREGLEPLFYTTLAPGLYDVYLHADDYERLEGILPLVIDEARAALDKAIDDLNQSAKGKKWKLPLPLKSAEPQRTYLKPQDGWAIVFHKNTDEEINPGDLVIESTLALPDKPEMGIGMGTKRIRTIWSVGSSRVLSTNVGPYPDAVTRGVTEPIMKPDEKGVEKAHARITWRDRSGEHTFLMTGNQAVAGRGGADHWVDLKIDATTEISREHFRLRRDEKTGQFFIRDLSTYGTMVNGKKLLSSIEEVGGTRRDINREELLPRRASIRLADVLTLEFEAMEGK
jgi:hypothetical protein